MAHRLIPSRFVYLFRKQQPVARVDVKAAQSTHYLGNHICTEAGCFVVTGHKIEMTRPVSVVVYGKKERE